MTVNIILWLHRGGQVAGAEILRELLESVGCTTRLIITSRDFPAERYRADVNLFSSEFSPAWMRLARINLLIPNQEHDVRQSFGRMHRERTNETEDQLGYLRLVDQLLVKTRHAEHIYRSLGLNASYIGFTCRDRLLPEIVKENQPWLCVIGDSHANKDVVPVLRAWQRNPQFPQLLVCLNRVPPALEPLLLTLPNVSYRRERLEDDELRRLQNRCAVHICPSTMEGWGHAIVESMSTGALLLATGAPPMDEHVDESRGALFGFSSQKPHAFGVCFTIDDRSVEQTVKRVLALPDAERLARGRRAREYFLDNDRKFRAAFTGLWQELAAGPKTSLQTTPGSPPRPNPNESPSVYAEISAGELLDKISILRIKRVRLKDAAQLANVARELSSLESTHNAHLPDSAQLRSLSDELEAINASLWQTEDDLRRCEQQRDFGPRFVGFARSVYRLNDRRAALKKRINVLTGSRLVEEKLHPSYEKTAPASDAIKQTLRRGVDHQRAGDLDAAETCYRHVLELEPRQPDALHLLGRLFDQRGLAQEAIAQITRAIEIKPQTPEFHNSLGLVHGRAGDHVAAEHCFRQSLQFRPDYGEARMNLGTALLQQGKAQESVEVHRHSVRLQPDRAAAHYNLAEALRETGDFLAAAGEYKEGIRHQPAYAEAWNNLGVCHRQLGDSQSAQQAFHAAIQIRPEFAGAHWNHAMALLLRGDWAAGWEEYEWRLQLPDFVEEAKRFSTPPWKGEDLAGKTLLVRAEQGLGDTLQFIRYIPWLTERGARIILECQPGLIELLRQMTSISVVMARTDTLPPFDHHVPLVSLPHRFGTTLQNVPVQIPYLRAREDLKQVWTERLGVSDGVKRIGLAWEGALKPDPSRSCPAVELAALAGLVGFEFISLQRNPRQSPPTDLKLRDFPEANADMENTAALIANLDLVLSIDTSIAHLAGALGKPVWTMLPYCHDWRWLSGTDTSPWYPTMRLFRQERRDGWKELLLRVADELPNFR